MIIHIGMPKTGTTFLQNSLLRSKPELLAHNVLYLSTNAELPIKPPPQHRYMAHAIQGFRRRNTPKADFGLLDAHIKALKREIEAHPHALPILSAEAFFGLNAQDIAKLRAFFPGESVKILVYLRRQDTWVDSYFAQIAKGARDGSPEQIYASHKWHLDYEKYLDMWGAHFGHANIIVRPYERLSSGTMNIWSDFFSAIGAPDAAQVIPPPAPANVALSRELTLFLRDQHIYGNKPDLRNFFRVIDEFFPKEKGAKYISESLATRILSEVHQSNAAVATRYLKRERLFEDTAVSGASQEAVLSTDDVAQILGGVSLKFLERMNQLEKRLHALEKQARGPKTHKRWSVKGIMKRIGG